MASSSATAARDPRVPALQKQVAALQHQVAFDEALAECRWTTQLDIDIDVNNIFAAMFNLAPYSGPIPNDRGTCAAVGLPSPQPPRALSSASPFGAFSAFQRQAARTAEHLARTPR